MIEKFSHNEDYPKLVRDKIPEIISANGDTAEYHVEQDDAEYLKLLFAKLIEESVELQEAGSLQSQIEELADIKEVIESIETALELTAGDISAVQEAKRAARGGFTERIILDSN